MLSPNERHLYIEALRPPTGYTFDRGAATTFSLDLITLLVAPLSFALFECREEKGLDRFDVLEALRRVANKLSVFCQRGRIFIPSTSSLLYSYLEKMVIEAAAPGDNGVFHPKIWLLRYTSGDNPVIYKLLCLSRNITFDCSWDTILVLEGVFSKNKINRRNQPLVDFIRYLPELAVGKVPQRIKEDIELIADEVINVAFKPPPGFDDEIKFWPLGMPGPNKFPLKASNNRLLIVSPFLSEDLLTRFDKQQEKILISRVDSLDNTDGKALSAFNEIYVMDELAAEPEITDDLEVEDQEGALNNVEESVNQKLSGLHAKIYLAENGNQTKLLTGSANATSAAFNGVNVEFLVELSGNKKRIGIDLLLGRNDARDSFRTLLKQYQPPAEKVDDKIVEQQLEKELEKARAQLVKSKLFLKAIKNNNGYDVTLSCTEGNLKHIFNDLEGVCWPITLKSIQAKPLDLLRHDKGTIIFEALSTVAVTSFIAFELTARSGNVKRKISFVLNLPLEGIPVDRDDRILQSIIKDSSSFVRYILFLLAEGEMSGELTELIRIIGSEKSGNRENSNSPDSIPLLEELVRALSRKPEKIDSIAKLVEDLRKNPDGEKLLPEGFDIIWQPILNARRELKQS